MFNANTQHCRQYYTQLIRAVSQAFYLHAQTFGGTFKLIHLSCWSAKSVRILAAGYAMISC